LGDGAFDNIDDMGYPGYVYMHVYAHAHVYVDID